MGGGFICYSFFSGRAWNNLGFHPIYVTVRRPFNQKSTAKTNNFNEKVNIAKVNNVTTARPKVVVSVVVGNRNNTVKSSACWIWRLKGNLIEHISKDSGSYTLKRFNYVDPQGRLKSVKNVNGEAHIQALVDKKKVIITEASIRRDLRFKYEGGVDCLSNEVTFEQLILMGSIMASAIIFLATNQNFNFSKYIFDNMVLDLKEAKTYQAKEIARLKKRVKKLKQKKKSRTLGLKRLRKGRMIDNIDQDVEITLVNDTQGRMNEKDMFGVNDLDGDEVVVDVSAGKKVEHSVKVVEKEVSTADPITTAGIEVTTAATTLQISKDELTLAQTLIEIKEAKPKAITTAATTITAASTRPKEKGIVMQEPYETPSPKLIDFSQQPSHAKDKGKGKMVDPQSPLKRKDHIMIDGEVAKNLKAHMQAELEEEERLARLKEKETNIALIEI
nr:hypothetical protein [Tanacetum cinerariifolium]